MIKKISIFTIILVTFGLTMVAPATLSLSIVFAPNADFTQDERDFIVETTNRWTELITGYQDGVSRTLEITVDSFEEPFDSSGRTVFGEAVGSIRRIQSEPVANAPANLNGIYLYSSGGRLRLNVHPDAGPLNRGVILHEIGHVLGFGDLWEANELYNDGNTTAPFIIISLDPLVTDRRVLENGVPGEYRAENALREYRNEFDPGAEFIPVELDNLDGSAHLHWNEPTDFAPGLEIPGPETHPGDDVPSPLAISGPNLGEPFAEELMTSRRLDGSLFISRTTLGSFEDLGFTVDYGALESGPVPVVETVFRILELEPSSGDLVFETIIPLGEVYRLTQNIDLMGNWAPVPGQPDFTGISASQIIRIPNILSSLAPSQNFFRLERQ